MRRFLLAIILFLACCSPAGAQYVRAVAVTGFTFSLADKMDGTPITSGTVTGYRTIDGGAQTALTGTFAHEGNGQWSISSLTTTEMDGATIGLLLLHADAQPLNINLITVPVDVAAIKTKTDYLPSAAAGANGGLPTVDANNRIAGVQGTITTLDTLYTGLSAQHSTTQADISNVEGIVTGTSALAAGADGFAATKTAVDAAAADAAELNDVKLTTPRATALDDLVTSDDLAAAVTPFAAKEVIASRTWRPGADSSRADNIVTVKRLFAGSLMAYLPLNEDGDVQGVASVTITGPASVTATNLRKSGDGRAVIFDVPSLTTAGTYTVVPTGTTADDNTIPLECKLVVRP